MAVIGDHRFHLDHGGHSVTVQLGRPSGAVELLVDGKVVACHQDAGEGVIVLRGELPGDPPEPVGISVSPPPGRHDPPSCVMDVGGTRYPMPRVPLGPVGATPPAVVPLRSRLRRFLRRRLRRFAAR